MNTPLLNCDIGESFGAWTTGCDADIMPFIDCANIACGFHASPQHLSSPRCHRTMPVGASLLAMNSTTPRSIRIPALSLTTIVGTPPGASSLLQ